MINIDELIRAYNDYFVNGIKVEYDGELYDVNGFTLRDNNIVLYTRKSKEEFIMSSINMIMDEFNFERVHKAMECLNWTYYDGKVPTVDRLKSIVVDLLHNAFNGFFDEFGDKKYDTYKSYIAETGGFKVEVGSTSDIEEPTATVSFILEEF